MVFINSLYKKVVYHKIRKNGENIYYKRVLNCLRGKGYIIQLITCDRRRDLLKDMLNTPTQMCQFHLVTIVMKALRKTHQSNVGRELRIIIRTLKKFKKCILFSNI